MSGLAGKVRRATESDEFDLAGYDQARCDEMAKGAFTEPLPLTSMIRISFVVGGGKLVRQKYSDDLPKIFMSSMSAIGYVNDESAAVEVGSAGKYKYQHDTNKNLKFVHVFPKLSAPAAAEGGNEEEGEEAARPLSAEEKVLRCGPEQMARILTDFLPTYGQKKNLLDILKERIAKWNRADEKTRAMGKLTDEEDEVYNYDIGVDEIQEKEKAVASSLQDMVEAGNLTANEQKYLLESLGDKLKTLEENGKKAPPKLSEMIQKAKNISAVSLPPLKYATEIADTQRKLNNLAKLEASIKGKMGTIEQQRTLSEKPDLEEAFSVYSERSRGWFESDEVFQERLQTCVRAANARRPAGGSGGAGASRGGGSSGGGYPKSSGGAGGFTVVSGGAKQAKSKAAAPKTRNAFGALG